MNKKTKGGLIGQGAPARLWKKCHYIMVVGIGLAISIDLASFIQGGLIGNG